jgi:GT2 family glycosyltransferase
MAAPAVAIIIVNFNGGAFIDKLAASLAGVTYANRRLHLVDNASSDGSGERLASLFSEAEIILNQRNLGLAPAINQALARCLAEGVDYVLLLNPDTTQAPDFLDRLVDAANERSLVVPKVLSAADGRLAGHAGGFDWTRGRLTNTHDGEADFASQAPFEVETGSFSCMLIPAAAFRNVGLLDERLGMYYEDTDFSARARKAGYRILVQPASVIYHTGGSSGGGSGSAFMHYYATRNRPYVVRKHVSTGRFVVFGAYFLTTRLLKIVDYALHRQWRLARVQLMALRDFALGRMGMTFEPHDLIGP